MTLLDNFGALHTLDVGPAPKLSKGRGYGSTFCGLDQAAGGWVTSLISVFRAQLT